MNNFSYILAKLPYRKPFLFVDNLFHVDENGVEGAYTYPANAWFYEGHFVGNPVTPGVILTETMAQIGVVCLGIFLLSDEPDTTESTFRFPIYQFSSDWNFTPETSMAIALSSVEMNFYKPVFPGETVVVRSTKDYFRFQKLKCKVEMLNSAGELVCRGSISGMMKPKTDA